MKRTRSYARRNMAVTIASSRRDATPPYPDCYLHVEECRSGQTWIIPVHPNAHLDLEKRVKAWVDSEFGGELRLDSRLMPRLQGDYYAKIITDGRPPDSVVVWESGGFYLKSTY